MDLKDTLQQAITHHKAGELENAEQLYRSILSEQVKHPDANHNLGVLLKQGDKANIALPFFKTALESNPNQGQYWISYIDTLIHLGQYDAAQNVLNQGQSKGLKGDAVDQLKERLNSKVKPSPESVGTQTKPANTTTLASNNLEPAIQLRESGDYQKAYDWLEDWNLKHPNDPEIIAHLAHLLLLLKKDDLAFKKLDQALLIAPDTALVQRNLARIYLKKNKPNDALTAATKAFDVDSHNHENRLVLASALSASGEKIKALKLVESIIKTNSDYAEAYATRALLRLQDQDLKSAIVDCEKALSIKPHLVQLWALSAKLYYQEKNLLKAITALEQTLVIAPDNIDYMIDIGEFYREADKTEQSLSILSRAVELAPERENAWINYGTVLQQLERLTEAKTAYHNALTINPDKPELLNNLAVMAKSTGDLEKSVEYFTKAIQLNPDFAEAQCNLGLTLHELGQLEEAVKRYEQALAIKPDYAEAHYNLGITLKKLGQLDAAVKSFEQALSIKPGYAEAQCSLGTTLQELGQLDAAVKHYEQALSIKPDYAEAHYNLGTTLRALGQLEAAVKSFKQLLTIKPDHVEAHCNIGNTLQELGQLEAAVKSYEQALAIKPDFAEGYSNLGITLHELGQLDAAVKSFEQALSIKPDYAEAQCNLGITLKKLGQLDAAVKSFEQALSIKPDLAEAHYNLGNTLKELGQLAAAVKRYEQALAIKPDFAEGYSNLGVTLQELGQLDAAVKRYEQALVIKPDYAEAQCNLGNTLKELGKLEVAVKSFEQALSIKPDLAEAHYNLGNTLKELGQLDAAVKRYEQALSIKPDYAEAQCNLGITLKELGQLEAAVKRYEQALVIKPDYAEVHNNLGITLKELGQLEAAVKRYEQALVIKPDYAEAQCNLGNTLKELGQLEAAVKRYEQALDIQPDFAEAWGNVFFTAKALDLSSTQNNWLESYKKNLDAAILNSIHFKLLEYRLNAFNPHAVDDCFNDAINALPLISHEKIQNPSPPAQSTELPSISNNTIALIHFGRSGTGLLHSLIDNHPEISTLPSIYFSEYYNADVWGELIAQGWDQLPENFIKQFAVLFDARSSMPIPSIDKPIAHLGQKEGMANVGVNRDDFLTVDQNRFASELRQLMADYANLTPQTFFTLVHSAYDKALNNSANKQSIFYHIHNPSPYATLNFLRYNPEAKLLMMVREPVQSCESWVKKGVKESAEITHTRIVTMLFDIDQIAFRRQDSIGVRLEDLKARPEATMAALGDWMGIEDSPTLYEMTAQGKKWWGDPSSPDYSAEGMSPFDDAAIIRKVGSVFSVQDQFILRTLFYPFSVRFGYAEENLEQFKADLKSIKLLLDEPFGFQEKLAENLSQDLDAITRSGAALYLRAALHDRWAVLNEFNDYPHMLKPLVIQES
jgi:tetratricopeptide (TPR) repeat protein